MGKLLLSLILMINLIPATEPSFAQASNLDKH